MDGETDLVTINETFSFNQESKKWNEKSHAEYYRIIEKYNIEEQEW